MIYYWATHATFLLSDPKRFRLKHLIYAKLRRELLQTYISVWSGERNIGVVTHPCKVDEI